MPIAIDPRVSRQPLLGRITRLGLFTVVVGTIALGAGPGFCGGGLTTITWGTPTTISGTSDVSTSGTLVYAFNFGASALLSGSTATVNGVPFAPFAVIGGTTSQSVGSLTIAESPGALFSSTGTTNASPFSTLPSSYQFLLQSGAFADEPGTVTITLGGLTGSQDYIVQWWSCNAPNDPVFGTTAALSGGSGTVTLDTNVGNSPGQLGQYVIGSFTADGSTATFQLQTIAPASTVGLPLINAIQVRAVPEPSGYGLALVGCGAVCGLVARRRRRRATRPTAAPRGATSPR